MITAFIKAAFILVLRLGIERGMSGDVPDTRRYIVRNHNHNKCLLGATTKFKHFPNVTSTKTTSLAILKAFKVSMRILK